MKTKKIFAVLTALFMATAAMAEEAKTEVKPQKKDNPPKTLFDAKDSSYSGYGGVYTKYARIGEANSCLVGGRGGLIINDTVVLGLAGMGLTYPTDREKISGNDYTGLLNEVGFGYGGFLMEYYLNPKDLIVFSAGTLIGAGGVSFHNRDNENNSGDNENDSDAFFVLEPEVNVLVNVTRFCRIGVGASYRYTSGINTEEFDDKDFRGFGASIMAQFGWF